MKVIKLLAAIFFTILLINGAIFSLSDTPFNPDSWMYYELSNSICHDFYHVTVWRAFDSMIPFSRAFPPVWPSVIAIVNKLSGLGIYSGYFANFVIVGIFAAIAELIARRGLG